MGWKGFLALAGAFTLGLWIVQQMVPVQAAMPLYRVYSSGSHGCIAVLYAGSNPIAIAAWSTPDRIATCGSGQ